MPVIGEQFGLSNADLGLANSIFFLTYAVVQIPFGALGDKIGRRLVIMLGFILFGAMTYATGLATTFVMFLIIRALVGGGQGAYYGPQYALSSEAIPTRNLTLGTAIINSGMAFGTSGGYLLSSQLVLENGQHWSRPFFITAIPTIIVGILFYVVLKEKIVRPEDQEKTVAESKGEETTSLAEDTSKISLGSIFGNRNLLAAFILVFTSIYANFVIITWLPTFLIEEMRADKMRSSKKLIFTLMPLATISVFLMAFVTNRTLLIAMLILYRLTGKLALDPIMVAFVSRHAPRRALGTALSAYNFVGMSGSILAPYITGFLSDVSGSMQIGFYVASVLLILGTIAFASLAREEKQAV